MGLEVVGKELPEDNGGRGRQECEDNEVAADITLIAGDAERGNVELEVDRECVA